MVAISASKKKTRISKKAKPEEKEFRIFSFFLAKILFRVPSAIIVLVLIFLWSSSTTIISGNLVHVCVSARKLNNVYCISAGTRPNSDLPIPLPLVNDSSITNETAQNMLLENPKKNTTENDYIVPVLSLTSGVWGSGNNEKTKGALKNVEELIKEQRSWSSSSAQIHQSTCDGRGIYVYELPAKFNKDLAAQCADMIPWENLCKYFKNGAMGEPIAKLGRGWYQTHQYSLELIFHSLISNHPCRVYNQNEAKLFYVPFYGGLDILRWHFKNVSHGLKDSLGLELVRWLESQPAWFKKSGKDHVFVLGKISWDFRRKGDSIWGSRFLELDEMQNPIKLLIERQPWHVNDIGVPHPTYFHPQSDDDIIAWQLTTLRSTRRSLVSFAGAARPDAPESIRSILIKQCTSRDQEQCKFLNCSSGGCDKPESIIQLFMESEFCLQPPGDSPTRKSVFDSLVSGCIPVLFNPFTAYYQYPWHLPEEHEKYSVLIDQADVGNMKVNVVERLAEIPVKKRENMRIYIIHELLPGLLYRDPNSNLQKFNDAFSITMNNLFERVNRSAV